MSDADLRTEPLIVVTLLRARPGLAEEVRLLTARYLAAAPGEAWRREALLSLNEPQVVLLNDIFADVAAFSAFTNDEERKALFSAIAPLLDEPPTSLVCTPVKPVWNTNGASPDGT